MQIFHAFHRQNHVIKLVRFLDSTIDPLSFVTPVRRMSCSILGLGPSLPEFIWAFTLSSLRVPKKEKEWMFIGPNQMQSNRLVRCNNRDSAMKLNQRKTWEIFFQRRMASIAGIRIRFLSSGKVQQISTWVFRIHNPRSLCVPSESSSSSSSSSSVLCR